MATNFLERGALVKSLAGHDEGGTFVIIEVVDGNYVRVADGKTRKIAKSKLKKVKHVKPINAKIDLELFENRGGLTDGDLQREIKEIIKKIGG